MDGAWGMEGWAVSLFVALTSLLSVGGTILMIVALIEVLRIPDHQFRAARTDKVVWVVVVAVASCIGALVWWFTARRAVLAAAGQVPPPPPGWYPDPATGAWRWWDGQRWAGPPHTPDVQARPRP